MGTQDNHRRQTSDLPAHQITVNGKRSYIATGHHTTARYWDAKGQAIRDTVKDAALINADLAAKKTEALHKIHDDRVAGKAVTANSVKRTVATQRGGNDFFAFADRFTNTSKARKNDRTIVNYISHTKHFRQFARAEVAFEDITPAFLGEYETHLRAAGLSPGYVRILLRHIRIVFNAACKEG